MKKLTAFASVLALAATLSITGCKKKTDEAAPPTTEAAKPEEKKPEEMKPAEPAPAPAPADQAAAPAGDSSGIAECDAYLKTFEKYLACEKVPQQSKDASKQGLEAMKSSWAQLKDPNVPAETKKAAADACKTGEDGLKQSATALGCTI
jgi:hypothetical protein